MQLGCDLELIEPRDASFVAGYFTGEEEELISCSLAEDQPSLVTLLWSAKESTLKALREGLRLDTRCMAVTLDTQTDHEHAAGVAGQYRWRPLEVCYARSEVFHGWWQTTDQLVRTLVGAPAPLAPLFLRSCAVSEGTPA